MPRAIVGIGGNLGARRAIFACAEALLSVMPGCSLLARSRLYETPALGPTQPDYLNGAFALEFKGHPLSLLALLRDVEQALGRMRRERWGPRTVDLDILHWSDGAITHEQLTVPHVGLTARSFALAPLLDVAPDLAPHYAQALATLGGPPTLAQDSWLLPAHFQAGLAILSPQDRAQLAWLLVGTVAQCGELS